MTTKILVSVGSSIAAVVAAGTGAQVYQRTQQEREEARLATVAALQSFDQAIERVKTSIRQSAELRDDLLKKTDALFKDAGSTEKELVEHGDRARELQKRHTVVTNEAGKLIADAKRTVELITRHFPEHLEELAPAKRAPSKEAIAKLLPRELTRIGCTLGNANDFLVLRFVDDEVDKLVDALLKDAVAQQTEEAAA